MGMHGGKKKGEEVYYQCWFLLCEPQRAGSGASSAGGVCILKGGDPGGWGSGNATGGLPQHWRSKSTNTVKHLGSKKVAADKKHSCLLRNFNQLFNIDNFKY